METLGDYRDEMKGTELGTMLEREVSKASRLRGGRNFWGMEVASVEEMGDAAGDFHTGTKHKRLREDIATTRAGIAMVCEVIVHEDVHSGNEALGEAEQRSEGVTHWRTQRIMGTDDDIYDEEVDRIKIFAAEISAEKVEELAKKENSEILLLMAWVLSKVKKGVEVEVATKEGAEHLKKAFKPAA